MQLEQFLVSELFAFLLIFTRIGSALMVLPGIGETYVSPRFRLPIAVMISLVLVPFLEPRLPPVPTSPLTLFVLLASELITGLFMGIMARMLVTVTHTVGMIMSYQSSLAAATMFDVSQASQGSGLGNFLGVTTVVILFATDLHHLMLAGLVDSYELLSPGQILPLGDMVQMMSTLVSECFKVAFKLSSPLIVSGLMIYLGAGLLARVMPNMQVFFVIIPPQIQISFAVITLTLSGLFFWYIDFIEEKLRIFVAG